MALTQRYITNREAILAAEYALASYEVSADKRCAYEAGIEYLADEFGVKASKSQAAFILNLALTGWEGYRQQVLSRD